MKTSINHWTLSSLWEIGSDGTGWVVKWNLKSIPTEEFQKELLFRLNPFVLIEYLPWKIPEITRRSRLNSFLNLCLEIILIWIKMCSKYKLVLNPNGV